MLSSNNRNWPTAIFQLKNTAVPLYLGFSKIKCKDVKIPQKYTFDLLETEDINDSCHFKLHADDDETLFECYRKLSGFRNYSDEDLMKYIKERNIIFVNSPYLNNIIQCLEIEKEEDYFYIKFTGRYECIQYDYLCVDENNLLTFNVGERAKFYMKIND